MQQTYFAIRGTGRRADGGAGRRPDDQRPDGRRRRAGVPQRSDDAGSRLPDGRRRGGDADRRHQHEPGAEGRRQPVPRRRSSGRSRRSQWQGDNLTDDLQRAWASPASTRSTTSTSSTSSRAARSSRTSCGSSARSARRYYDKPIANTFQTDGSAAVSRRPTQRCAGSPVDCEQGISDEKMDNPIVRLTWQASERNKFAVYMDRALRLRGHAMGALTDPQHRVGDLEHADSSRPARRSGPRRCRRSCCSRPASRSTASATTTCISPASSPSAARRRGIATSARTTPAPASCGTPRARSSATIPTATTSRARCRTSPARTTSSSA